MMNKKGISPLIATVLLVSFVVVLSLVIFFWGKQYVTELIEKRGDVASMKLECESVELEIVNVIGNQLNIRNMGSKRISGFMLRYIDADDTQEINDILEPYGDLTLTLNSLGKIDVIPMLRIPSVGAPSIPCSSKHKLINTGG